jgi:hypothetical protein
MTISQLKAKILQLQLQLLALLKLQLAQSNAERLITYAKAAVGQNLALGTGVSPEVACAISVNIIETRAFGTPIGGGASTALLDEALEASPNWARSETVAPGILMFATGKGTKPEYPHGHVLITDGVLCWSNSSADARFEQNYTVQSALAFFRDVEGYPAEYFARL